MGGGREKRDNPKLVKGRRGLRKTLVWRTEEGPLRRKGGGSLIWKGKAPPRRKKTLWLGRVGGGGGGREGGWSGGEVEGGSRGCRGGWVSAREKTGAEGMGEMGVERSEWGWGE